jgi:hypothetical protein
LVGKRLNTSVVDIMYVSSVWLQGIASSV